MILVKSECQINLCNNLKILTIRCIRSIIEFKVLLNITATEADY